MKEVEYAKYKQMIDEMTLSSLIFQLKSSEYVSMKILEQIDDDESISSLNSSIT